MSWTDQADFECKHQTMIKAKRINPIKHALHKTNVQPAGMEMFYKGLEDVNMPEFFTVNDLGKMIIGKSVHMRWSTPGELVQNLKKEGMSIK